MYIQRCGWCAGEPKCLDINPQNWKCPKCGTLIPKKPAGSNKEIIEIGELKPFEFTPKPVVPKEPGRRGRKPAPFNILTAMGSITTAKKEWLKKEMEKGITCPKTKEKLDVMDPRWSFDGDKWVFKK